MLRRLALLWVTSLALAHAQPAHAETILHLAETATVMVAPDEIAATLTAEATGPSPSDAQAKVNATMQDALNQAHKVQGVAVSTGGYGVWRTNPPDRTANWQVNQTLNLFGHDGPALLTLVGALQQHGLAVSNLGWRLSRAAERQAHQTATKQALTALRGRVDEAAALLELRFDQFKAVRLDGAAPQPLFRAMAAPMAMSSASAAPPPSVAPEDMPVSATADADAVLVPK
jgi:predicted secreted protein